MLYVLFGGTQSVLGPLLGAAVFTLLPELLRSSAHWRYVLFAAIIIVVMVVRPQGLVTGAPDPAAARHAQRRRAQGAGGMSATRSSRSTTSASASAGSP